MPGLDEAISTNLPVDPESTVRFDSLAIHSSCHEGNSSNNEDVMEVIDQAITDSQGHEGIYTGEILVATLLPHGKGSMQYTQLDRSYDGEWKHGQRHGSGQATFPNGDSYDGHYVYDKREGRGHYKWKDGREYRGEFKDDKRHGKGKMWWPDGAVYQGDFFNGFRDGYGLHDFANGDRYEGSIVRNKFDGEGSFFWADGGKSYHGEWKDGEILDDQRSKEGDVDGGASDGRQ